MALRTMSVDIGFNADLSAITRLDSTVDGVVSSVTGGMDRAENSVGDLGSEFSDLSTDASRSASRVGGSLSDIGSDATSSAGDVGRIENALNDVGGSGGGLDDVTHSLGTSICSGCGPRRFTAQYPKYSRHGKRSQ